MPSAIGPDQVHDALLCLYRPFDLARCELARAVFGGRERVDVVEQAQALRGMVLDAIEKLRPAGELLLSASASRAHDCISLRYLSGLSIEEVAAELSLSPRQVYRDLHWGEARLAELLAARGEGGGSDQPVVMDELAQEIETLARRSGSVELATVLLEAAEAVSSLCEQRGVALVCDCATAKAVVTANRGLVKQLVMQVLSVAAQGHHDGTLRVTLEPAERTATITVPLTSLQDMPRRDLLETALRIARSQRCTYEIDRATEGTRLRLTFTLASRRIVLVVEDNPSTFALYQRYLENSDWQPIHAAHPRLAVDLAIAHKAEALILDLMLPESDGWSVLQAVRTEPRTSDLPVIICSVLSDVQLACALGATAYLTKPLSRSQLVRTLRRVTEGDSQGEGE